MQHLSANQDIIVNCLKYINDCQDLNYRAIISFQGEKNQFDNFFKAIKTKIICTKLASVGHAELKNSQDITNFKSDQIIGNEYDCIVYCIDREFNPNLLASCIGTIIGGGLLFLTFSQSEKEYIKDNDAYTNRIVNIIENDKSVFNVYFQENTAITSSTSIIPSIQNSTDLFSEQNYAIKEIAHQIKSHRNRPLVILGDRGRGKSTALGKAIKHIIDNNDVTILVTSASHNACEILLKQTKTNNRLPKSLSYLSPDNIILHKPKADMLIIDEAAAIPLPMLENMLSLYSRIVFCTTTHGYEGSGQSFTLRFFPMLSKNNPGWKKIELHQSIRWREGDPLERLANHLFLFKNNNTKFDMEPEVPIDKHHVEITASNKTSLIGNERQLAQLMSLLSSSHYRTQPSDLKQIINNHDITLYSLHIRGELIGCAYTIAEGKISGKLKNDISDGKRRIRGNLTPQSLSAHLGLEHAIDLQYLRLVRIAIHPQSRNMGLGTMLIEHIKQVAKINSIDILSCSYGINSRLFDFWRKNDFTLVRIGHSRNASSGTHSGLMLLATSKNSKRVEENAYNILQNNFLLQLQETLQLFGFEIVIPILKHLYSNTSTFQRPDSIKSLLEFTSSHRKYEDNLVEIHNFFKYSLTQEKTYDDLTNHELSLLILKIIQHQSWSLISDKLNYSGKKSVQSHFKKTLQKLLNNEDQPFVN